MKDKIKVIEERKVGKDIGGEEIKMGMMKGIIGLIIVEVLIMIIYGLWGVIENVEIMINKMMKL